MDLMAVTQHVVTKGGECRTHSLGLRSDFDADRHMRKAIDDGMLRVGENEFVSPSAVLRVWFTYSEVM